MSFLSIVTDRHRRRIVGGKVLSQWKRKERIIECPSLSCANFRFSLVPFLQCLKAHKRQKKLLNELAQNLDSYVVQLIKDLSLTKRDMPKKIKRKRGPELEEAMEESRAALIDRRTTIGWHARVPPSKRQLIRDRQTEPGEKQEKNAREEGKSEKNRDEWRRWSPISLHLSLRLF